MERLDRKIKYINLTYRKMESYLRDIKSNLETYLHDIQSNSKAIHQIDELEFRLGRSRPGGAFDPKHNSMTFQRVINSIKGLQLLTSNHISLDIAVDKKLSHVRVSILEAKDADSPDGRFETIRQFFINDHIPYDGSKKSPVEFIKKQKNIPQDLHDLDLRIQAASEQPVNAKDRQHITDLIQNPQIDKIYRYKQRYSFKNNLYRFDLTAIRSGSGTSFRESKTMQAPEEYEIELEYLEPIGNIKKIKNIKSLSDNIMEHIQMPLYHLLSFYRGTGEVGRDIGFVGHRETELVVQAYQKAAFGHSEITKTQQKLAKNNKNIKTKQFFIGYNVLPLTKPDLQQLESIPYAVTEKADGDRHILFIYPEREYLGMAYLINPRMEVKPTYFKADHAKYYGAIIDGEYVLTRDHDRIFLSFDCLRISGHEIRNEGLEPRIRMAKEIVKHLILPKSSLPFVDSMMIMTKNYFSPQMTHKKCRNIYECIRLVLEQDFLYKLDGIILTPILESYPIATLETGRNWPSLLKWKPLDQLSVDFMVFILKDRHQKPILETINNRNYHILTLKVKYPSGVREFRPSETYQHKRVSQVRVEIQEDGTIRTENEEQKKGHVIDDNQVIEAIFQDGEWKLIRFRPDKTTPNFYKVAESNWKLINEPITREMITTGEMPPSDVYYQKKTEFKDMTKSMRKMHNLIKRILIIDTVSSAIAEKPKSHKYLLDLGSGQGGDALKWKDAGLSMVIGVEYSESNVKLAQERLESNPMDIQVTYLHGDASKDLNSGEAGQAVNSQISTQFMREELPRYRRKFDVVSAQFMIHYMMRRRKDLRQFLKNVSVNLRKGGYFIGTTLDGQKIYNSLERQKQIQGQVRNPLSNEMIDVWRIERKYTENTFKDYGQTIDAFNISIQSKAQTEWLVNLKFLEEEAKAFGLEIINPGREPGKFFFNSGQGSFENFYRLFPPKLMREFSNRYKIKSDVYLQALKDISQAEMTYSRLASYFIFKKISEPSIVVLNELYLVQTEETIPVLSSSVPSVPSVPSGPSEKEKTKKPKLRLKIKKPRKTEETEESQSTLTEKTEETKETKMPKKKKETTKPKKR